MRTATLSSRWCQLPLKTPSGLCAQGSELTLADHHAWPHHIPEDGSTRSLFTGAIGTINPPQLGFQMWTARGPRSAMLISREMHHFFQAWALYLRSDVSCIQKCNLNGHTLGATPLHGHTLGATSLHKKLQQVSVFSPKMRKLGSNMRATFKF